MGFSFGNAIAAVDDIHIRTCLKRLGLAMDGQIGTVSTLVRNNVSTSNIVAGAGLTGGGPLNAITSATLDVGAGTGITVTADAVSISSSYLGANPTGTIGITAVNGSATTYMRSDAAPAFDMTIARPWTAGVHTFSVQDVHNAGVSLGTSGVLVSNVADGTVGFSLTASGAQTGSIPIFKLTYSPDTSASPRMSCTSSGEWSFGPGALSLTGSVLRFTVSSQVSLPLSGNWWVGIQSALIHASVATAPANNMNGVQGVVSITSGANSGAMDVAGVVGSVASNNDVNTMAGKQIAAVLGTFRGAILNSAGGPFNAIIGAANSTVAGNWARVSAVHGIAFNIPAAATIPTNLPTILAGGSFGISAPTGSESWGVEIYPSTTGKVSVPPISGGIKIGYPFRGTRLMHAYFVPTAAAAAGPTGNASGDVYFDTGTNNPIGLAQHNGTNWQWLLTPTMNANGAIAAGNAGTVSGLWQFDHLQTCTFDDAKNIVVGSTTGTKIGTATTQKLGFYDATPIVQSVNTVAINDVLVNMGLRATGGVSNFSTDVEASIVTAKYDATHYIKLVATGVAEQTILLPTGTTLSIDKAVLFKSQVASDSIAFRRSDLGTGTYGASFDLNSTTVTLNTNHDPTQVQSGLVVQQAAAGSAGSKVFQVSTNAALVPISCDQNGDLALGVSGKKIGFFNHAVAAQPSAYTPSNVSADRSYDANSTTVDELADVLGTLIADLQSLGLVA